MSSSSHLSVSCSSLSSVHKNAYEVIVVGAGTAGIAAARELTTHGINSIIILEGSDRIGGRVNTITLADGRPLELGAQWIHGETGNIIYKLAKEKGLIHSFMSVDGEGSFFTESGEEVNLEIVNEVCDVMEEVSTICGAFADNELSYPSSVHEFYKKMFQFYMKKCNTDSPEIKQLKAGIYHWFIRWERVDNACKALHNLSAKCWGEFKFCHGSECINPLNGMSLILNSLLEDIAVSVKLNCEVVSVQYSQVFKRQHFIQQKKNQDFPVRILCKSGDEYFCNHVIFTASLGYIKENYDVFSPPLPTQMQEVISSLGYGTIGKIFLEFEKPWWPKDCEGIQFVWTKDNVEFKDLTEEDMPSLWHRSIVGFDPVFNHEALLCGWIAGPEAEYVELLSESEVLSTCTSLLRRFTNMNVPYPKRVYKYQWKHNKFALGSYSFRTTDYEKKGHNIDILNQPVCASLDNGEQFPVVVLAGEANSLNYYSTVHGAYSNGQKQSHHYINSRSKLFKNVPVSKL